MSYHAHRNAEQYSKVEGQAQLTALGSSEASINEVMQELSHGHAHMLKKGIAGSSIEESYPIGEGGGGFKKLGGFNKNVEEMAQLAHGMPSDQELKHLGKSAKFGIPVGEGFANDFEKKKVAMKNASGGESFGQKALEKNINTSDNFVNGLMLGVGTVLGPIGLPLVITAEARMMRDRLAGANSISEVGSGSIQKEMIHRQKMLKSWKQSDE